MLEELACQAALLGTLAQRWTASGLMSNNPESAATFNRMATACVAANVRTAIALEWLRAQRQGRASVVAHDDDIDEDA